MFVVEGHGKGEPRVLRFDKSGKLLKSWGGLGKGPGQFDLAHSVVIDAQGLVYVADRQNRRVQVFDVDGRFVKEWRYAGLPCGLYLGADQQMYLASGFAGQILKLDKNGKAIAATGQPGKGLGEFGEAHYLTIGPRRRHLRRRHRQRRRAEIREGEIGGGSGRLGARDWGLGTDLASPGLEPPVTEWTTLVDFRPSAVVSTAEIAVSEDERRQ